MPADESIEQDRDDLPSALKGECDALQKDSTELEQAYSELQAQLTATRKSVQDLKDDRGKLRQDVDSQARGQRPALTGADQRVVN